MKLLFIGDVVGDSGQQMVEEYLPRLKKKYQPQVTIINGENAAGGKGINEKIYKNFLSWGAQAVTLGNHAWDKKEIFDFIEDAKYLVRPANFPEGTPGNEIIYLKVNQAEAAIINLQARTFMMPSNDPFRKADALIAEAKKRTNIIFVDFHGEATSEKQAFGWYLDGRVSAVIGTHTHTQTADERILPGGTAYISDAGMTGPYDAILGVDRDLVIKRFLTGLPVRFEVPKKGKTQLNGVLLDIHQETGRAQRIQRIMINEDHPFME